MLEPIAPERLSDMNEKKMKGDAAFEVAREMPDEKVTLTAAEVCGVGQLAATFSKLGLMHDPFAQALGRKIHAEAQRIIKENNINTDRDSSVIIKEIDTLGLPNVEMEMSVVGLTTMCGLMKPISSAFVIVGGPTFSGWEKLLKIAVRLAKEIREKSETEHMLRTMKPKLGLA